MRLAVADVGELDLVAGLVAADDRAEVVGTPDDLVVDLRDDVAAQRDRRPTDLRVDVAAPQTGLRGRAAGRDRLHERAALDREQAGEGRVDRLRAHAQVGVLDRALRLQVAKLLLDRVDRDREADADVAVAGAAGLDLRVDADDAPGRVEQRAARVAGVDRRIGLDD